MLFKIHKDVYPNLVAFILGASDINAHAVREVLVQRFKPRPTPAQEAALSGKIDTMAITAYLQRNCDTWLVGRRPAAIEWLAEKSLLIANSSKLSPTDTSPLTNPNYNTYILFRIFLQGVPGKENPWNRYRCAMAVATSTADRYSVGGGPREIPRGLPPASGKSCGPPDEAGGAGGAADESIEPTTALTRG